MVISIAIPDSSLNDEKSLENKTRKIGLIGRACSVFRVNEIIIYRDGKENEHDSKLLLTILKFMETPQYFRKQKFPKKNMLRFTGLLPPLKIPNQIGVSNHKLVKNGDIREGLIVRSNGKKFVDPVQRMREYVEIIRLALTGSKINYSGKIFSLENFSLLIKPPRANVPIYLAAVNQKMINLTWEIGDGVILYLRPKNEIKSTLGIMQKQRKIDSTLQIITCVHEDSDKAVERAKKTLAFYISVGEIYRKFLASNGYKNDIMNIYDEYKSTGLQNNFMFVTDKMVKDLCICGTPSESQQQLKEFKETGIDLPILQFNPIDNTESSFDILLQTFGDV